MIQLIRYRRVYTLLSIFLLSLFLILLMSDLPASTITVLAFGDSLTAGYKSKAGGYPTKLATLLIDKNKPAILINKGISGEKTAEGLARFDSVLAATNADIVLIMEGSNDLLKELPLEDARDNLQAMIDKAKAARVIPVLANLPPSTRGNCEELIPEVWNPMIASLARDNNIPLVDQYSAILPFWRFTNSDGIHFNEKGYWVIAKSWYDTIAPWINSMGNINLSNNIQQRNTTLSVATIMAILVIMTLPYFGIRCDRKLATA